MISHGCIIKALPGLRAYDELTQAAWFLGKKVDALAFHFLVETKRTVDDALKAELIKEKVAHAITEGIDETIAALDSKDYEKADESILATKDIAIDEAMQQAAKCEFEKITEGLV